EADDNELKAGVAPPEGEEGLASTLGSLWAALPLLRHWNPHDGWHAARVGANPYPSASLLALLLLGRVPENRFVRPADIERWVTEHHPFWGRSPQPLSDHRGSVPGQGHSGLHKRRRESGAQKLSWIRAFLLGYAYQLRVLQ